MKRRHLAPMTKGLLAALVIPVFLLAAGLFTYTIYKNYEYNIAAVEKNEESAADSMQRNIASIEEIALDYANTMDFLFFSNSSNVRRVTRYAEELSRSIKNSLTSYGEVCGIILYNSQTDRCYRSYTSYSASSMEPLCQEYLQPKGNRLAQETALIVSEDRSCLLYVIRQRYGSLAVMIDPAYNDVFRSFSSLYENVSLVYGSAPKTSLSTITSRLEDTDIFLVYRIRNLLSFTGFNSIQVAALLLIAVFVILTVILFLQMQHILLKPLEHLSDSFELISAGDRKYRIQENSNVFEIDRFYTGFNDMLDNLQNAEDESHRQQMDAAQAKLQYLQLQIRPHFYLNCLKNINSLAEIHEDEKIQTLVISLSDYFRYNFQDVKNYVTIREELEAVQSYVDLCRCLYNEIELQFDVESDVLIEKCLPLTTLTFVENSIKHGKELRSLVIRIRCRVKLMEDGEAWILTEVENTGEFSEEALKELNAADSSAMVYQREKVGISNVRYRMWLIYGERYSITFANRDGFAVVSIQFPIKKIDPDDERS